MINPCINCLVDVMCLDACDKFISYLDYIPLSNRSLSDILHIVGTEIRFERARKSTLKCQLKHQNNSRLHYLLDVSRKELL